MNMTVVAASSGVGVGKTSASAVGSGQLGAETQQARTERWTPAEHAAEQVLLRHYGMIARDANRWVFLERMESNLRPLIGGNLNDSTNRYVNALQSRLTDTSYARTVALNTIRMLKDDPWSSIPFSGKNNELNEARSNVQVFDRVLANTRVEIDNLLQKNPNLLIKPASDPKPPRIL
jgi:hypothetical protein